MDCNRNSPDKPEKPQNRSLVIHLEGLNLEESTDLDDLNESHSSESGKDNVITPTPSSENKVKPQVLDSASRHECIIQVEDEENLQSSETLKKTTKYHLDPQEETSSSSKKIMAKRNQKERQSSEHTQSSLDDVDIVQRIENIEIAERFRQIMEMFDSFTKNLESLETPIKGLNKKSFTTMKRTKREQRDDVENEIVPKVHRSRYDEFMEESNVVVPSTSTSRSMVKGDS